MASHEFLHMKRDRNQSADRLASEALGQEKVIVAISDHKRQYLITLNRLSELQSPERVD